MKISRIKINSWRLFRDVEFCIPENQRVICLVGENGTGKTSVLELLAVASQAFGLSSGLNIPRGIPLNEPHDFEVELRLSDRICHRVRNDKDGLAETGSASQNWDGTLLWRSVSPDEKPKHPMVLAGGFSSDEATAASIAKRITGFLRRDNDTHYLFLDADRAYPPVVLHSHDHAEALSRSWEAREWCKDRSFNPTTELYQEWSRYVIARETASACSFFRESRSAKDEGRAQPVFVDPHEGYRDAVRRVLPHLEYDGVINDRKLAFRVGDVRLTFDQLSAGERDIAFLIGQMQRFRLESGLLLVDQPELHLNSGLIRSWLRFLENTISEGQIWIASHSLETVESVGLSSTFFLTRDIGSSCVEKSIRLDQQPRLADLCRALGYPGFSLERQSFVFIEGERGGRERDRFDRLMGPTADVLFIPIGGCKEVLRYVEHVSRFSRELELRIRVGGIVDADHSEPRHRLDLSRKKSVFMLGCHEIENLFLYPPAIERILIQIGEDPTLASDVIQEACDQKAGQWVWNRAICRLALNKDIDWGAARTFASKNSFGDIVKQGQGWVRQLLEYINLESPLKDLLRSNLDESVNEYRRIRNCSEELWRCCEGKQVISLVSKRLRSSDVVGLEVRIATIWQEGNAALPRELVELRDYIRSVSSVDSN